LKIGATPVGLPEQWNIAFEHVSPGPKSCGVPPPTEDPQCRRSPAIGITSIEAVEGGSSTGRRARPFQAATVRGDTVDGTLDNIREAIELCLGGHAGPREGHPGSFPSPGRKRRHHPMTSGLPVVSGREAIRVFERLGYSVVRQRGSHIRLAPCD
jgi:HicA toxin of bacterial toxin-antitoxin,